MLLVKRSNKQKNPWDGFGLMDSEVDSLFDSFLRGLDIAPLAEKREHAFNPSMDVLESEKEIKVSAELPGMEDRDVEVTLEKDTLTIRGEKKAEAEKKEKGYYHTERTYGSFTRTVQLPAEIESEKIEARFKNGVLTVTVPKSAKAVEEKRKIKIAS